MFGEFRGLPVHALVVHAAVVLLPATALLGVLFIVPRWRARLRWPLLVATLISLGTLYVTRQSGYSLKASLNLGGPVAQAVAVHQQLANQLVVLMLGLTVAVVAAFVATRPDRAVPPGDASRRGGSTRVDAQGGQTAVATVLAVLVLVGSIAVAVQTARVGEAGARALWNPTGQATFNGG